MIKNVSVVKHPTEVLDKRREKWDFWHYQNIHDLQMESRRSKYVLRLKQDLIKADKRNKGEPEMDLKNDLQSVLRNMGMDSDEGASDY